MFTHDAFAGIDRAKLTGGQRAQLKRLDELDLADEIESLVSSDEMDRDLAVLAARELKRFLALGVLIDGQTYPFIPSLLVDTIWHKLILNTKKYRLFCEHFGDFIDHEPAAPTRNDAVTKLAGENYGYTKQCISEAFGELPENVWGPGAKCDRGAPCWSKPPCGKP